MPTSVWVKSKKSQLQRPQNGIKIGVNAPQDNLNNDLQEPLPRDTLQDMPIEPIIMPGTHQNTTAQQTPTKKPGFLEKLFGGLFKKKEGAPSKKKEATSKKKVVDPPRGDTPETAYRDGDLFYGLARGREGYMQQAVGDMDPHLGQYVGDRSVGGEKSALICDTLNNQFLGTPEWASNPNIDRNKVTKEQRRAFESYHGKREGEGEDVKGFREFLEGHKKYDPRKVAGSDQIWDRIGKACKGGIEYTTKKKNKNIHFCLDGFNDQLFLDDLQKPGAERAITSWLRDRSKGRPQPVHHRRA